MPLTGDEVRDIELSEATYDGRDVKLAGDDIDSESVGSRSPSRFDNERGMYPSLS